MGLGGSLVTADGRAGSINEGDDATLEVTLSERPTADVTVKLTGRRAKRIEADTTLTFTPANFDTKQNVTVTAPEDDNAQGELATLKATASGGGYDGRSASVKVTSEDPDVLLAIDDVSITEGTTDTVTITATRAQASGAVTVPVVYTGGTAAGTAEDEFTVAAGAEGVDPEEIAFAADKTTASIKVAITAVQGEGEKNDDDDEDDAIVVTLAVSGGRGLPTAGITITIVDDDKQ